MNNMNSMFIFPNPRDNQSNNLNSTIKNKDTEEIKINQHSNINHKEQIEIVILLYQKNIFNYDKLLD